jgi:membrane associated rhomboid family serine protease
MQSLTPIVKKILLLNVVIFLAQQFLGFDFIDTLGLRYISSAYFKPYQFFTHLFVHASFAHLFSNMFALFTFGPVLEYTLTSKRFVSFYIFTGLGAAVLYSAIHYMEVSRIGVLYNNYLAHPDPQSFQAYLNHFSHNTSALFYEFTHNFFKYADDPAYITRSKAIANQLYILKANVTTVGVSGAIFGLLTAFAMLFPNAELSVFFIPIKAKYFVVIYGVYELYAGVQANPADNVAHFAHLGGILFGYLFIKWWKRGHKGR